MWWRLWTGYFIRDTHNTIQESTELCPLYWIGEIVHQHVISRTVLNCNFTAINEFLNVEVPAVYVIFMAGTWFNPILLQ